jgi:hypothetical protein
MDAISEERLAPLIPILSIRVRQLETNLGFPIRVTQAGRSAAEQDAIWSQGRFNVATVNAKRAAVGMALITEAENVIVTHALPGHSWHEYFMAADIVPMDPVPDWDESHPQWKAIVAGARPVGLLDGISFHDDPHLQPIELPVSPTPKYITLLKQGIPAVWAATGLLQS